MIWQASGKVGVVNVNSGDQVQAGDTLAILDSGSLSTSILTAQTDLSSAQTALSELTTSQTALLTAQVAVIDAQTALDKAQNHRDMMNSDTRGTDQQIRDAAAAYARAEDNVKRARAMYDSLPGDPATELHNKAPALLNLEKAKTARDTALSTLNWYAAKWSASDIGAADQALALAKATLGDAQTALAKLQQGPDATQLATLKQRIAADNAIIKTQTIVAPFSGTITNVNVMAGDIVSTGATAFRIDDTSDYYINLSVSEVDIAKIQTGQTATITLDAISDKTYHGTVSNIGQIGATSNSVVNFTVTVKMTDADSAIKPGMTASAEIVVSSAENVLVAPVQSVKTVSGQKVVYVLGSTGSETVAPVTVQVGLSSDTWVEVTSTQLKVGDQILLNPSMVGH